MAGKKVAAVLDPGAALEPAFEQVAALRCRCERHGEYDQDIGQLQQPDPQSPEESRRRHSANQPRPCLVRTDRWCKPWSADRAPGEISADIDRPGRDEHPQQELEPERRCVDREAFADPQQGKRGDERVDKSRDLPAKAPAMDDAAPFVKHHAGGERDQCGERVSALHRRHQGQCDQQDADDAAPGELAHRPPNRRWRAA